jgi:hypothetical protein
VRHLQGHGRSPRVIVLLAEQLQGSDAMRAVIIGSFSDSALVSTGDMPSKVVIPLVCSL